ncbi:uncharacterized protein HGUI_01555 [Hanseniaspora guilliermondii]|uniref:Sec20 C-terminal domain-containing protein n=1 Tax=Hanseniaspora guilliermondii TaxID=56406 RepID=A0A1L0B329_9ASCO|nr:uncharacterized protein HGUI_01555 [Hanseniaspora guilliermondii]
MTQNIDSLEGQARNIRKLRNDLAIYTKSYKVKKSYTLTQIDSIKDITNKLRYAIEQYCFYLNMMQDYIQVTIPVDPFVDVLDIVGNEELSEEKQFNILELLDKDKRIKNSRFTNYEREWFEEMYNKLDFIIENYSFLQHWERYFQGAVSENVISVPKSENTKDKVLKKFEKFKEDFQNENGEVFTDVNEKATAEVFEDKLKDKNKQITSSLIRSNQILKSTVLQTDLNLEEIYIQGNMLTELNDKFDILDTLLTQSSKIMKLIEKNGSKEKRRVYMSLGFLAFCISWVVWKRLIRGPLKLVLWLWFNFFKKILSTTGLISKKKIIFDQPLFEEVTSALSFEDGISNQLPSVTETLSSVLDSKISTKSSAVEVIKSLKNNTINSKTVSHLSEKL